jgi:hypothetical protein
MDDLGGKASPSSTCRLEVFDLNRKRLEDRRLSLSTDAGYSSENRSWLVSNDILVDAYREVMMADNFDRRKSVDSNIVTAFEFNMGKHL